MATRSTIALEFADGTVQQVYCHWDGYLEHNGQILLDHYSNPFKLQELIDLGDVSTLSAEIGVQHSFDAPSAIREPEAYEQYKAQFGGMTLFYGRDRGETGVAARKFANFGDYAARHQHEDYEYILRTDGQWWVKQYDGAYELLAPALAVTLENQ